MNEACTKGDRINKNIATRKVHFWAYILRDRKRERKRERERERPTQIDTVKSNS